VAPGRSHRRERDGHDHAAVPVQKTLTNSAASTTGSGVDTQTEGKVARMLWLRTE
jgi:hypothetical protein